MYNTVCVDDQLLIISIYECSVCKYRLALRIKDTVEAVIVSAGGSGEAERSEGIGR